MIDLITLPYSRPRWSALLRQCFSQYEERETPSCIPVLENSLAASIHQLGTVTTQGNHHGETLFLAVIELIATDAVALLRNRVGIRNLAARLLTPGTADGLLIATTQPGKDAWRFTFVHRETRFTADGDLEHVETPTRRFTYVLGPGESCRTPNSRFQLLARHRGATTLTHILDAFSVEKLSNEFFTTYKEHYKGFCHHLIETSSLPAQLNIHLSNLEGEERDRALKPIRDFVKKLLGRLIFLAFLQRKGWLHAPAFTADWSTGDKDFLRTYLALAGQSQQTESFHSRYLAPLFFQALNTERPGHLFPLTGTRMPYLNGGLFDPDSPALQAIDFPPQLFTNLFAFFAEYNFTIDENDPEDHEVGIDPEMLGHIFENLLEDNKDKGAYYTPKVIVSYMCRQSILRYLETHLGKNEALTRLCEHHEPGDLREKNNWCAQNAKAIATHLENVKICDPAIGSGAFPIGMLNEIVHLRTLLNAELNDPAERATLKRNIIAHSIHGVDLDSGAVDIARLRFWLALVVDEETPSPLPNLDYKIMQGNSLLESFRGVDLSTLHGGEDKKPRKIPLGINALSQSELDIFTDAQQEFQETRSVQQRELQEAMRSYFAARKPERKATLRALIDGKVLDHIRHYFEVTLSEKTVEHQQAENDWAEKRRRAPNWNPPTAALKRHAERAKHLASLHDSLHHLAEIQHQAERPYFLWHLLFRDVFENGGFDIVIANPPYVRQELIKEQKPLLEKEGYTTYTGTADLLVYFYERATTLLKPGGVLTFITSNKFYRAGYGEKLRSFLAENLSLHTLIDFRDAPVFNGVIAYASILIGSRTGFQPVSANGLPACSLPSSAAGKMPAVPDRLEACPTFVSTLVWDQSKPAAALPQEIANAFPVPQSSLTPDGWRLVSPAVQNLLTKLRNHGTPLGEYVNGRFYYGIKTGFNEAFVIDGKKRTELIAADPKSEEIIKPFLRGRDVKRWQATHADLWLIKIESSANVSHPWKGAEKPWDKFCETYPAVAQFFESLKQIKDAKGITHWQRLKDRDDQGMYFWELRSCAYWQEFEKPKIIYPELDAKNQFAKAKAGEYADCTCYVIPNPEPWLIAVLSSGWSLYFMDLIAAKNMGGAIRWKHQYIENLPIPPATDAEKSQLAQLAEACATATAAGDKETLAAREAEINTLVYHLFHLTPAEIALIEGTLKP